MAQSRPALIGSIALHAGVIMAALVVLPRVSAPVIPQAMGEPTPVTLVSEAPMPAPQPAPEPTPAATPTPEPDASTEAPGEEAPPAPAPPPPPEAAPAPPRPQPRPTPPAPAPTPPQPRSTPPQPQPPRPTAPTATRPPAPAPRPASQRPTAPRPALPRPAPQRPSLDLDAIARAAPNRQPSSRPQQQARLDLDSLARLAPGPRRSAAPAGPPRPRAGPPSRPGSAGRSEETALALGIIQERVTRNWNLDCANPEFASVRVRVTVNLNQNGGLVGEPHADIAEEGGTRGVAAQRAVAAVRRAAPFDTLPPERYAEWRTVILNFNAREACRG